MVRALALLVVALVAATPENGEACSCGPPPPLVSPRDQDTAVPTNAVVTVFHENALSELLDVRLEIVGGERVPLVAQDSNPHWFRASPALLANTTYRLTVDYSAWAPDEVSVFTTGASTDVTPSDFAGLTRFAPKAMSRDGVSCANTCDVGDSGYWSWLELEMPSVPDDAILLVLSIDGQGEFPYRPEHLRHGIVAREACSIAPVFEPGREYCGRLLAYDVAGNVSGDVEVCAAVERCGLMLLADECRPSRECAPDDGTCRGPLCVDPGSRDGGCATSSGAGALAGLAVFMLRRRRRISRA